MKREEPFDFGGKEIDPQDIVSDELLGMVQDLNRDLGTPNDPYYNEYEQFRDEIANAELIVIDPNLLTRGTNDSLDLSGESTNIEDFDPMDYYQTHFVNNTEEIYYGDTIDIGINQIEEIDKEKFLFNDFVFDVI